MLIFSELKIFYYTVAITLILIFFNGLIDIIKNRKIRKSVINIEENKHLKVPLGFYLSVSNIFLLLLYNFFK